MAAWSSRRTPKKAPWPAGSSCKAARRSARSCSSCAALKVLAAQPEVDAERLTALLMYVDQRIKTGYASCSTFLLL